MCIAIYKHKLKYVHGVTWTGTFLTCNKFQLVKLILISSNVYSEYEDRLYLNWLNLYEIFRGSLRYGPVAGASFLPLNIMTHIHCYEYLVGQQRRFGTPCPKQQTHRYKNGRQLLNEPGEFNTDRKSISTACISAVWNVFKKRGKKCADCKENCGVG